MDSFRIMLIKVNQRVQEAARVQEVLTEYGCQIKMRLGLHEAGDQCANQGLILLQLTGEDPVLEEFARRLGELDGVTARLTEI